MTRAIYFVLFAALGVTPALHGYDFLTRNGLRWRDGDIPMNLQLDATMESQQLSDGKGSWNAVAEEALGIWNSELSRVQFTTYTSSQRGDGNEHNEVFFSTNAFGHRFGDLVLAVTTTWRIGSERVEGDTIVNSDIEWDSYRGTLNYFGAIDLRRVIMHEFGHTLGLDHPDEAGQVMVALMNSTVSDLETIALDDIRGIHALYPPAARYMLNFNVTPADAGEVIMKTPVGLDGRYPAGSLVTLLVKPHRHFRFNFWGGDEISSGRKLTFRVVDNENITLNFSTNGAPAIHGQPRSRFASVGDTVTFTARATGRSPIDYQWQHDGVDVPGATQPTLRLDFVGHEDSGLYSLRVRNVRGQTFSKPARLVVDGY
jgi:hypothetical protein